MKIPIQSLKRKSFVAAPTLSCFSATFTGCYDTGDSGSNSSRPVSPDAMDSGMLCLDHTSGKSSGVGLLHDRFWIDIDFSRGTYTYDHVSGIPSSGTVSYSYSKTEEERGELTLSFSGGYLGGVSEVLYSYHWWMLDDQPLLEVTVIPSHPAYDFSPPEYHLNGEISNVSINFIAIPKT
jgi:hypothetical protein